MKDTAPKISIIVPVYNMERYLRQCVDSIIAQTFTDWELILVNDGSKDASASICDEYASSDARIRVIHKENSGQADSRNIALKAARADLIGFVDSDDWIEPDMYEVLYRTMMENDADISVCGYFKSYVGCDVPVKDSGRVSVYDKETAALMLLRDSEMKSFLWDKLFRKEVITHEMPKSYRYEDYSTLIKWFVSADRVAYCRRPEYHYRMRKGSTDHEANPIRMWHFFLAEKERCTYMRDLKLIPGLEDELSARVLCAGVTQAKDIARLCDHETAVQYVGKILHEMDDFDVEKTKPLGLRLKFRLALLRRSPEAFIRMMKASLVFNMNRFRKGHGFYE